MSLICESAFNQEKDCEIFANLRLKLEVITLVFWSVYGIYIYLVALVGVDTVACVVLTTVR